MKIFKTRYRIVGDNHAGFEAQFRYWWFPVWFQLGGVNTFSTEQACMNYINRKSYVREVFIDGVK